MPQTGFEPAIPANLGPQNHTLDRVATGIRICTVKIKFNRARYKI
jgi:hypothetical protein